MSLDHRLTRMDAHRVRIDNPYGIPATLFANDQVAVERSAVDELMSLLEVADTLERLYTHDPSRFSVEPRIAQLAVTPDFHKARGVPVGSVIAARGFVVPQAIGTDINCGMRLHTTTLSADAVHRNLEAIDTAMRHLFFEGGRDIPMTGRQREALFLGGLEALFDATPADWRPGLWRLVAELGLADQLDRVERRGSLEASRALGLEDFIGDRTQPSRDAQIGSIGGGNHFVEVQVVHKVLDRVTAHAWGLTPGMITVMVHTGSVSIGHRSAAHYRDSLRTAFPAGMKHPENGVYVLPDAEAGGDVAAVFWDALHNAGNFAFANRMFLGVAALAGLLETCGDFDSALLYDAPHNFLWREEVNGELLTVHRKGATPARGMEQMQGGPFAWYGEPVLVPGSMGASSFVLAGNGCAESLASASHGAGRVLSRGAAVHGHDEEFEQFLKEFRVVMPLDLRRPEVRQRRDILEKKLAELKQEAPFAYKGIGPVVDTLVGSGIARPVAELRPILTVKG